jgi:beta-1,4-mannosyltransferase
MFSEELSREGYIVREFRWRSCGLLRTNFIFLHWPDEFFVKKGSFSFSKSLAKLGVIHLAKLLWGTKLVWVAHNAAPHEGVNSNSLLRRWFLRSLDGVVFLSEYSRKLIQDMYPETRSCDSVVTVHAHYRSAAIAPERPYRMPDGDIQLVQFGTIRPYKNFEASVEAMSSKPSGIKLLIAGMVMDRALGAAIEARAQLLPNVRLDFREGPISDAELEAIVDSSDAVVLPYKNILNSGAALFSLSRNRPVLAPNMGSLPELRDTVGQGWIYLYDGEFCQQTLVEFREWMISTDRATTAPLDAYELSRVGRDLRRLLEPMRRVTEDAGMGVKGGGSSPHAQTPSQSHNPVSDRFISKKARY